MLPATMFRMMTSMGSMSSFHTSISRSSRRSRKCVGTPLSSRCLNSTSEMALLTIPLEVTVPSFFLLKALASSLKYWIILAGSSVA